VPNSGTRRRFTLATAFFCVGLTVAGFARADQADDLAGSIATHIRQHSPAVTLAPADEARINSFTHYLLKTAYYPVNLHDLQTAALAAIDLTDASADTASLTQAAFAGMLGTVGHGARFLTTLGGGDAPAADGSLPSTRDIGALRVVTLPTMSVAGPDTRHTCADFARYFDLQSTDNITGFVLDLRGNDGGALTDSACLSGFFIKNGQLVFQTINKQGEVVKYQSDASNHKPTNLPVAVLIDSRTDSGALLVAAILQGMRHATVIGQQRPAINGAVSALVFPPGANRAVVLPTGEILLADKRPLAAGLHVDVAMAAQDEIAMLNAARPFLARRDD
jgi:hypothetical protein